MPPTFRLRSRIPGKDDPFLLRMIKENLSSYPSSKGWTDDKIIQMLHKSTRVMVLENPKARYARIGFLTWTEQKPSLFIGLCVIDQKYQRMGIASRYRRRIEAYAKKNGFTALGFYVDMTNTDAIRLYQRFGFSSKKVNPSTGTILMEKQLYPPV